MKRGRLRGSTHLHNIWPGATFPTRPRPLMITAFYRPAQRRNVQSHVGASIFGDKMNDLAKVVLAVIVGLLFPLSTYYVHELGHQLVYSVVCVSQGKMPDTYVSNWQNVLGIPLPQQSYLGKCGYNLAIGLAGPLFTLIYACSVILAVSRRYRPPKWIAYSAVFAFGLYEFFGNFLFGTDNSDGKVLLATSDSLYEPLRMFNELLPLLVLIFSIIFFLACARAVKTKSGQSPPIAF